MSFVPLRLMIKSISFSVGSLPWYDLAMNDKIDNDFVPIDFWEGKLDIIIQEIVASKGVLIDLLSDNYRDVLSE